MLLAFLQRPHAWVVPELERLLLVLVLVRKWPGRWGPSTRRQQQTLRQSASLGKGRRLNLSAQAQRAQLRLPPARSRKLRRRRNPFDSAWPHTWPHRLGRSALLEFAHCPDRPRYQCSPAPRADRPPRISAWKFSGRCCARCAPCSRDLGDLPINGGLRRRNCDRRYLLHGHALTGDLRLPSGPRRQQCGRCLVAQSSHRHSRNRRR